MGVLIIGYGNPLRGDDGVGWRVVEDVQRRKAEGGRQNEALQSVEAVAYHQLMPELAESISRVEQVVFVDAAVGEPAGAISVQIVQSRKPQPGAFTHHVDPAGLLAYAEMLYGRVPIAHLVTINADRMGYEETLSPVIEGVVPELLNQIAQIIQN